jgi:putative 2OG-Fe(II) oxygenase
MTEVENQNSSTDIYDKLNQLKHNGFVNIGGGDILFDYETEQLRELSSQLLTKFELETREAGNQTDFVRTGVGEGAWALTRFPQHHPAISQAINKVVNNANIKVILQSVLGNDYKIWQIALRRSSPGDKGLYLHQDSMGETGLVILLTDNLAGDGATFFLPKSHLLSKTARKLGVEAPAFLVNFMCGLLKPFTGKAGDIGFFFNRTWHGRFSNTSTRNHDAILISFFPSGATYGFGGSYLEWSQEYLNEIRETELGRLLDPSFGTELVGEKRYKVASLSGNKELPYALQIANPSVHKLYPVGCRTYSVILFLRVIMPIGRITRRVIAALRSNSR